MLTVEEQQHKDDMVSLTEQVLDAKGIECDSKVSKTSEEQLKEIIDKLEGLESERRRMKKIMNDSDRRRYFHTMM